MSDSRQTKPTKSKSRNKNQVVKSHPSTSSGNVIHTNYSISSTNISYHLSGPHLPMPTSSLIGKIDLEHLKQATFRNIKTSLGSPSARDDCINYALEMVISNLIINGRLDPAKAQNMRTPLMKAQIASICDKMLKNRGKKLTTTTHHSKPSTSTGGASGSGSGSGIKKQKTGGVGSRSKQPSQKWAIQPVALPITVVTDHALNPSAQGFISTGSNHSSKVASKKSSTGSCKSNCNVPVVEEQVKKKGKKKKCKSLESSSNSLTHSQQQQQQQSQQSQSSQPAKISGKSSQSQQQQPQPPSSQIPPIQQQSQPVPPLVVYPDTAQSVSGTSRSSYVSSEVPSYNSFDYNSPETPEVKSGAIEEHSTSTSGKPDKTVQFDGAVLEKNEDDKSYLMPATQPEDENSNFNQANGDKVSIPFTPVPVPLSAESRCASAGTESCPSSTKTLNALISSSCSLANSNANGFQILVDMKGFHNEEISMEVEGRQLIFLAARPKRNDLNLRKVTEIVDVPPGVNLENLKIGRRTDGFVLVEEYEVESEPL